MNLDIKKITSAPEDKMEAFILLNKVQQKLIEALYIMDSVLESNTDYYFKEFYEKRMKDFIKQFEVEL